MCGEVPCGPPSPVHAGVGILRQTKRINCRMRDALLCWDTPMAHSSEAWSARAGHEIRRQREATWRPRPSPWKWEEAQEHQPH